MAAEPKQSDSSLQLLASIIDQLACPACFSSLVMETTDLVCARCGCVYPVVDGIPVLIAGQGKENQG